MSAITTLVVGIISAALVNNVVLSQFLGICPFLGVSRKTSTAVGMGTAVICVITVSSCITYFINVYILGEKYSYLRTIVFILIIAGLVQSVEIILKKKMPSLYKSLGVYLPLITTNCSVLGVAIDSANNGYSFAETMIYSVGTAIGFLIAIVIMSGIRENIEDNDIPEAFKGMPIVLVTAGLMAIAFVGFSGTM